MKSTTEMYKEVIVKRLERKNQQLKELERIVNGEGVATPVEKRKFIELKATINELENVIDLAESILQEE